jgi:hypothetical protein
MDASPTSPTLPELLAEAIAAEEALAELGESIDDEWSYVNDLCRAWTDRLADEAAACSTSEPADPRVVAAIRVAIDEAGLIRDPHRAIDWLSTLPQVVLLAAGA